MRAIFALLVLAGLSYARPQELGAVEAVETAAAAAADTPAEPTNVEAAPAAETAAAEGDVNRQGLLAVNAQVAGEGGADAGAGGAGAGAADGAGAGAGAGAEGAGAGAGGAGGAGGAAAASQCSIYGCAFYGPGLNNPQVTATPAPATLKTFQDIAVQNPQLRVFVGTGGQLIPTDIFGQEVEIVDQFGGEIGEALDPIEAQEIAAQQQLAEIERRAAEFRIAELAKIGLDPAGQPLPVAPGQPARMIPLPKRIFTIVTAA